MKCCKKCDNSFLATTEFFYKARENKDGLAGSCKSCCKKRNIWTHCRFMEWSRNHYPRYNLR